MEIRACWNRLKKFEVGKNGIFDLEYGQWLVLLIVMRFTLEKKYANPLSVQSTIGLLGCMRKVA